VCPTERFVGAEGRTGRLDRWARSRTEWRWPRCSTLDRCTSSGRGSSQPQRYTNTVFPSAGLSAKAKLVLFRKATVRPSSRVFVSDGPLTRLKVCAGGRERRDTLLFPVGGRLRCDDFFEVPWGEVVCEASRWGFNLLSPGPHGNQCHHPIPQAS
jgi:hypothetical protein